MRLANKAALVTGAGSGLGRETALYLAEEGAAVAVNDVNAASAEETAMEIRAKGGTAIAVPADVSNSTAVREMFASVLRRFGTLDILVNNAGIVDVAETSSLSDEAWRRVIGVHLDGTFFCTREALKTMLPKRSGKIVNVSSVVGMTGGVGMAHYAAAKAGVFSFTATVGREVASKGVNVNAVAPGAVETPMLARLQDQGLRYGPPPPIKRAARSREVASLIAYLASDEASYLCGETININGGGLVK